MTTVRSERQRIRDETIPAWTRQHSLDLDRLDDGQRWVVFAGIKAVEAIGPIRPLRRAIAYFLTRSGMGLTDHVIGAIIGTSERAVRTTKGLEPRALLEAVAQLTRGHCHPKLGPEHAGHLARFIVDHPKAEAPEILSFLETKHSVSIERHTLAHFIERYGLGCLRDLEVEAPPFLSDTRNTPAPSS